MDGEIKVRPPQMNGLDDIIRWCRLQKLDHFAQNKTGSLKKYGTSLEVEFKVNHLILLSLGTFYDGQLVT